MLLRMRGLAPADQADCLCSKSALSREQHDPVSDDGNHICHTVASVTELTGHAGLQKPVAAATGNQAVVQRLITDLAARCVKIEPEAIDDAIADGMRQFGEVLAIDLAVLCRRADDGGVVASHSWSKHQQTSLPDPSEVTAMSFVASTLDTGQASWFKRIDELRDPDDREAFLRHGLRSAFVAPVALTPSAPGMRGALILCSTAEREWTPALIEQLRLLSGVVAQVLARRANLKALQHASDEVDRLRARLTEEAVAGHPDVMSFQPSSVRDLLHAENLYLRREARERLGAGIIVGQSATLQRVLEQARQVAATDSTVLLLGETGTGKELIATHIHELSARRGRTMVRVNCAAIPSTLIESELFGREKGAFTGALAKQVGRFELADHSTIFLDEIGDLPPDVQVKLLRVLEERQIERLGSPRTVPVNVRIIAATHRDLEQLIAGDTFRQDLYYRLNVFPIQLPPLRERTEDIPRLVWRFVDEFSKSFGKRIDAISRASMDALQRYPWPGNIRELRNVVERAMIVAVGHHLSVELPTRSSASSAMKRSDKLADVEKEHVLNVVEGCRWRIRGVDGAAERLGLRPTTLETRMAKLGITRPQA